MQTRERITDAKFTVIRGPDAPPAHIEPACVDEPLFDLPPVPNLKGPVGVIIGDLFEWAVWLGLFALLMWGADALRDFLRASWPT